MICLQKYVNFARNRLIGAKNGPEIGKPFVIALKDAKAMRKKPQDKVSLIAFPMWKAYQLLLDPYPI